MSQPQPRARFIGSRELHRDLPKVVEALEDPEARFVLTIHNKPKAVILGADAFLGLLDRLSPADRLLALQLGALVQGHESNGAPAVAGDDPKAGRRRDSLVAV